MLYVSEDAASFPNLRELMLYFKFETGDSVSAQQGYCGKIGIREGRTERAGGVRWGTASCESCPLYLDHCIDLI